jgi:hypothetical protein
LAALYDQVKETHASPLVSVTSAKFQRLYSFLSALAFHRSAGSKSWPFHGLIPGGRSVVGASADQEGDRNFKWKSLRILQETKLKYEEKGINGKILTPQ